MTSRREFLKGAAAASGMIFCGCEMHGAAWAQGAGTPRLPVIVKGKRIKTIDVHSHCLFREASDLLGVEEAAALVQPIKGAPDAYLEVEKRSSAMDAQGIDIEVLSINPFW